MGILSAELRLHVIRPTLKELSVESGATKTSLWSEAAENLLVGDRRTRITDGTLPHSASGRGVRHLSN